MRVGAESMKSEEKEQYTAIHNAIVNNTEPPVTMHDGVQALKVCYMILDEINKNQQIIQNNLK